MQQEKIWYLQQFKLFENFTKKQMDELNRITHMKWYKKAQPIFLSGETSRSIYLLKQGRVKICKTSETGKTVTLAILEPGEIFGEIEALEGVPRTTIAEALDALEDVLVCEILHNDFERYLHNTPQVGTRLFKLIGPRIRQVETRVSELVFRTVPARLAQLFIQLSERMGKPEPDGIKIRPRLTHKNLGDLVGAARETVSLTLGEFVRKGLISQNKSHFTILNKDALIKIINE